jgi:hypothetical protein
MPWLHNVAKANTYIKVYFLIRMPYHDMIYVRLICNDIHLFLIYLQRTKNCLVEPQC